MTAFLVIAALSGCGSVCDQASAAERGSNQKGINCSVQNITVHDANKCNSGLQKCNSDDLNELQNYVNCLGNLQACQPGNETSFNAARNGCVLQAATRLSFTCSSNIL